MVVTRSGIASLVRSAWQENVRLFLPIACPCGVLDVPWCDRCEQQFNNPPIRVEHGAARLDRIDGVAPLPVWAVTQYVGPVRNVIVQWKDHDRVDLNHLLSKALQEATCQIAQELAGAALAPWIDVVPVPTTASAQRRRGRDAIQVLANAVVHGLRDGGASASYTPVMRRQASRDQVGLGIRARGHNTASSIRCLKTMEGRMCVIVDDVLTSGATMAACERAVESAGGQVIGAIVLAATPSPRSEQTYKEKTRLDRQVRPPQDAT